MTTTNLRKKAKQYGIKGYTKMSKEELLKHIYVDEDTQTDGAFFARELRKFTAKEQAHQVIDKICWDDIVKHRCSKYIIYDEVRTCTECGDTKGLIG